MRRGLMHAGAWAAATAAAVTLSWFGVRSVLRSTAYDPPRAMPIATTLPPQISATQRPSPRPGTTSPSPRPTPRHTVTGTPRPSATATGTHGPAGTPPAAPTSPAASGEVHAYTVGGGRVVLSLDADAASLVSATPESGWQMSVWTPYADQWLRVTFTSASGDRASTVSCTWNGHPPEVTTYEN